VFFKKIHSKYTLQINSTNKKNKTRIHFGRTQVLKKIFKIISIKKKILLPKGMMKGF
jgi:hypothetical protein